MAKYDVYRLRDGGGLVLDCQADLLDRLNTRLVVPLMPPDAAPPAMTRLNPMFAVEGQRVAMITQFAATIPVRELGERVESLVDQQDAIGNALDMLVSGFCQPAKAGISLNRARPETGGPGPSTSSGEPFDEIEYYSVSHAAPRA